MIPHRGSAERGGSVTIADLFSFAQSRAEYPAGIPPDVCALFEKLAMELRDRGWRRYSSDAILHRIRWHHHVERGNRAFKANDHWTAKLSRWFMNRHPEMSGFFETRSAREDEAA